jgi:hypothetical protein
MEGVWDRHRQSNQSLLHVYLLFTCLLSSHMCATRLLVKHLHPLWVLLLPVHGNRHKCGPQLCFKLKLLS